MCAEALEADHVDRAQLLQILGAPNHLPQLAVEADGFQPIRELVQKESRHRDHTGVHAKQERYRGRQPRFAQPLLPCADRSTRPQAQLDQVLELVLPVQPLVDAELPGPRAQGLRLTRKELL
jgi:hypothetical protein